MVILYLTFWRTTKWFSTMAAPFTFLPATHKVEGITAVCWFSFPLSFLLLDPLLTLFPLTSYFLRGLQVLFKSGFYALTFIHSPNYPPRLAQNMETYKLPPPRKEQRPWCHEAPAPWTELGSMDDYLLGTYHLPRTQDSVVGEERDSAMSCLSHILPSPSTSCGTSGKLTCCSLSWGGSGRMFA